MFGYGYKEDALKWRDHVEKQTERKFQMIIEITLKDGDTQYCTYQRHGRNRDVGFLESEYKLELGDVVLEQLYGGVKELAGKEGLECDSGIFIPHSNIHHIRKLSIEEVDSE